MSQVWKKQCFFFSEFSHFFRELKEMVDFRKFYHTDAVQLVCASCGTKFTFGCAEAVEYDTNVTFLGRPGQFFESSFF